MADLITPEKVTQFCKEAFMHFCINQPKPVIIKVDDLDPNSYYLEGGTSNIAIGTHGRKTPVVLLNNGFWLHFNISFDRKNKSKGKSHEFGGLSIQLFREANNDMVLLFRAEWDNSEINEFEHAQPHWHFHPQREYLTKERLLSSESFNAYLELVSENSFENEISILNKKKISDISSFHFAMSSRWQNKESAIIPLTELNLRNWLGLVLKNIDLQLKYCN